MRYLLLYTLCSLFSSSTPEVFLSPDPERILHRSTLWMPSLSMLARSSAERKRSSKILKMSYPSVSWTLVAANLTWSLSTRARDTFCTRFLFAWPPDRLMLRTRASDPETITSCSESLGTLTYRVSPGLASEGLNVMRLTVRSAFMAPSVFSL